MATDRVEFNTDPNADSNQDPNADPNAGGGDGGDDLILGKFKTQEDLEAAYIELEKKQSGGGDGGGGGDNQVEPGTKIQITKSQDDPTGLDMTALSEEFAENGKLSDATYKKLARKGLDRGTVDNYVAGQMALATQYAETLTAAAGSQDELNNLLDWASENKTEREINEINTIFNGNNITAAKMTLLGLKAERAAAGDAPDADPNLVDGDTVPNMSGVKPFASQAQITAAMKDPKYKSDAAYRKQVHNRLAVTNF